MEDIDTRALANGSRNRLLVDVELAAQSIGHWTNVRRRQRHHNIDVQGGPWLPAHRTGERTADQVTQSAPFENLRHTDRDGDRVAHHHGPRRFGSCAASG
jgi:hypothetical protein